MTGRLKRQTFSIAAGETSKVSVRNERRHEEGSQPAGGDGGRPRSGAGATLAGAQDPATEEFARRQYESGLAFLAEKKYAEALKDFQAVVDSYPQSRVADAALLRIAEYQLDVAGDIAAAQTAVDRCRRSTANSESGPMGLVLAGRIIRDEEPRAGRRRLGARQLRARSAPVPGIRRGAGVDVLRRRGAAAHAPRRRSGPPLPPGVHRLPAVGVGPARAARRGALPGADRQGAARDGTAPARAPAIPGVRRRPRRPSPGTRFSTASTCARPRSRRTSSRPSGSIAGAAGKLKDIQALGVGPGGTVYAAHSDGVLAVRPGRQVVAGPDREGRARHGLRPVGQSDRSWAARNRRAGRRAASRSRVPKPDGSPRTLGRHHGRRAHLDRRPAGGRHEREEHRALLERGQVRRRRSRRCSRSGWRSTSPTASWRSTRSGAGLTVIEHDGRLRAKIPARGQGYEFDRPVDLAVDAARSHLRARSQRGDGVRVRAGRRSRGCSRPSPSRRSRPGPSGRRSASRSTPPAGCTSTTTTSRRSRCTSDPLLS